MSSLTRRRTRFGAFWNFGPWQPSIGVELAQERKQAEQGRHQQHAVVAVLDVGCMHDEPEHQASVVTSRWRFLLLVFLPESYPPGRLPNRLSWRSSRPGCQ